MIRHDVTTPVFVLAGGQGERLAPLTKAKPKPAVSFGGTHQIIDFTLSNCVNSGLRKIYVLTQYQPECLHDHIRMSRLRLANRFRWNDGDELRCVPPVSGKRYRGTADAVFQNLALIRFDTADHVMIVSGDHVYAMDYRRLLSRHIGSGADLTIAAVRRPVREAPAFGVLDVCDNGTVIGFREKPAPETLPTAGEVLVNMGVYVFRRRALLDLADKANPMETDFGLHIIPKMVRSLRAGAFDFGGTRHSYWRDVGNLDSYYQANMDLVGPHPGFNPEVDPEWPVHTLVDDSGVKERDSRISRRANIGKCTIGRSVVSRNAHIEPGAIVENSVILPGARVGKDARVRNAILAEGAVVAGGARVGENAQLDGKNFRVTPGGVVVVSAPPLKVHERTIVNNRRHPMLSVA